MQETGVLEEVQVLPSSLHGVMNRARLSLAIRKTTAAYKTDCQVKFFPHTSAWLELDRFDLPRGMQAQSHAK